MAETRTNPVVRLLPSLGDFVFLMPLIFLFARMEGASAMLVDSDTGWHLRAGDWMLANGRIPDRDLFSFTRAGEPWFAWEWLWDVAFGWLGRHFGLEAVVLVNVVLLGAVFVLVYQIGRRLSGNVLAALATTLLATAGSSLHWLARPHMTTLLMVAVFCAVLETRPDWRRMAFLVCLTVLWTNLHGGFFVGIAMLLLYGLGEGLTAVLWPGDAGRAEALRKARVYLAGAAGCAAASFLNPYGWRLHAHIYEYLRDRDLFDHVTEFQPYNFRHPAGLYVEILLLLGGMAVFWSLKRRRLAHALALAAWAHLAIFSARNVPIYLIVSAPVIALALREWLEALPGAGLAGWIARAAEGLLRAAEQLGGMERIARVHAVSIAAVLVLAALLYAPAPPDLFRARFHPRVFPVAAAGVLERSADARRVFTHDQWGGYLIYRQYPNTRVFVDGRSDFYGKKFSENWLEMVNARPGWQASLERYGIDAVLTPPGVALAAAMKESPRWRVVYDDGLAIIFRPAAAPDPAARQVSAVGSSSGVERDRAITKSQACDPSITTNNKSSRS